jgi:hypothetical protein
VMTFHGGFIAWNDSCFGQDRWNCFNPCSLCICAFDQETGSYFQLESTVHLLKVSTSVLWPKGLKLEYHRYKQFCIEQKLIVFSSGNF